MFSFSLAAWTLVGSACGRSADETADTTLPAVQVAGETTAPTTTVPTTTVPTQVTYVVQAGESLSVIASRFGVDVRALADFNAIADVDSLKVGQLLSIPPTTIATTTAPAVATVPPAPTTG
ncbi:MAG: LysM domain-containing protein [Actinomycetota bacterium]|nr:LysM domain-containing protein [Actinomycetota bacterium]